MTNPENDPIFEDTLSQFCLVELDEELYLIGGRVDEISGQSEFSLEIICIRKLTVQILEK